MSVYGEIEGHGVVGPVSQAARTREEDDHRDLSHGEGQGGLGAAKGHCRPGRQKVQAGLGGGQRCGRTS